MRVTTFSGPQLYAARLKARMTQEDLAFALRQRTSARTGARTIRRWEIGESTPHSALIPAIAAALGVTVDELYDADDDEEADSALLQLRRLKSNLILAGRDDLVADLAAIAKLTGLAEELDGAAV